VSKHNQHSDDDMRFGRHVRSLRKARGLTQEQLAEQADLSADTIRRLENGGFSPSRATLRKLCCGLELRLSTLFESYELGERNELRELVDLVATRPACEIKYAHKILQNAFRALDALCEENRD